MGRAVGPDLLGGAPGNLEPLEECLDRRPRNRHHGHRVGDLDERPLRRTDIPQQAHRIERRVLAESAWTYRFPARSEPGSTSKTRHLPEAVRDIAWKAQARLTKRYRTLVANGRKTTVAITAIARELAAFMWAIARLPIAVDPA
ncbi:hypothetical protein [Cereibacter sphaeroides]|uniref:hypothetical protein n=1 Tax=Cereibacter sphaeroides TaxID=1063 RepID=UPI001F2AA6D0|nr:hypothetical protein [Cereibacter sphaeroides]MCE6967453.1 hypothetical protein [Cereibacter sphaeroides]